MNCKKCGYVLTENDKFCKNCGTPVSDTNVPNNYSENHVDSVFDLGGNQSANYGQGINQSQTMQQQQFTDYSAMNQIFNQQPISNSQNNLNNYNQQPMNNNQYGANGYSKQQINNNLTPKNNKNLFIIIGVVVVGLFMVILFLVGNNKDNNVPNNNDNQVNENNNNSNNNSDNNEEDEQQTSVSKTNYKVKFQGFNLEIPDNLVYSSRNNALLIGDEADTWLVQFEISEGSFDKLKANKNQLKTIFNQNGFEASDAIEKTYSEISFIVSEVSAGEENALIAYARANSMNLVALTMYNQNNEFDYSLIEKICPVISSLKYVGESNNIEQNTNFNASAIGELAK